MQPKREGAVLHSLPRAMISKRGEAILIHSLDEKSGPRLVEMYLAYQPRNSFQGLPPLKDAACVAWVERMIQEGINVVALSFEQGVVGHAGLFPMDDTTCEFLVVVAPQFQDTGIGMELTRCSIQVSYELGYERIWLDVDATNFRARHVYKKCGFGYLKGEQARELQMAIDLRRYRDVAQAGVETIMRRVAAIDADEPCRAAVQAFLAQGVDALPVIDNGGELLGVISENDLLVPSNFDKNVRDVVTWQVHTVPGHCTIGKAVRMFQSHRVRCIPVVGDDRKLLGVVNRKDVLAYYDRYFAPAVEGDAR